MVCFTGSPTLNQVTIQAKPRPVEQRFLLLFENFSIIKLQTNCDRGIYKTTNFKIVSFQ